MILRLLLWLALATIFSMWYLLQFVFLLLMAVGIVFFVVAFPWLAAFIFACVFFNRVCDFSNRVRDLEEDVDYLIERRER